MKSICEYACISAIVAAFFIAPLGASAQVYYSSYDPYNGFVYDPYQTSYNQYDPYQYSYSYDPYAYQQYQYMAQPSYGYQTYPTYTYQTYSPSYSYPSYTYSYPSGYGGGTSPSPFAPSTYAAVQAPLSYNGSIGQDYNAFGGTLFSNQPYGGYGITRSYPWGDWSRCYWGSDYGYSSCYHNPSQPIFDPYTGTWY